MHSVLFWLLLLTSNLVAQGESRTPQRVAVLGEPLPFKFSGPQPRQDFQLPAQVKNLLGHGFDVQDFSAGDSSSRRVEKALEWNPHVIICTAPAGLQEHRQESWKSLHAWLNEIIRSTRKQLGAEVKLILVTDIECGVRDTDPDRPFFRSDLAGLLRREAVSLVAWNSLRTMRPGAFSESGHPSPHGVEVIAERICERILEARDNAFRLDRLLAFMSTTVHAGEFQGFKEHRFKNGDAECRIVFPKQAARGRPWIWRARFWGHEPQFDRAMLERGWHVVYCDVAGLYGNAEALKRWNGFYGLLTSSGLNKKAMLEGMSRGGLVVYEWAKKYPGRVMGIIADNPVCDPRSWPGGAGESERRDAEWRACLKAHGQPGQGEDGFEGFATRGLEAFVEAGIPVLHIVGEEDRVVPVPENSDVVENRLLELGGRIDVIRKVGADHHPHSLHDPDPIVRFALKAAGLAYEPTLQPRASNEWRSRSAGWGIDSWREQHAKIIRLGEENPDLEVVFLGDSITQSMTGAKHRLTSKGGTRAIDRHFGHLKAASFGLSGDRTEHILWRIDRGAFDNVNPKVIVLMIGVNNINTARHDGPETARGIRAIVRKLEQREPQAKVVVLGSLPAKKLGTPVRRETDRLHEALEGLADCPNAVYLDLRRMFLQEKGDLDYGRMSRDGVHITPKGYEDLFAVLAPVVSELLGEEQAQEKQPGWLEQAARVTPSPRQLAWQKLDLTCFIHFGVNTFTGREWGTGKEKPEQFHPTEFDAAQWVAAAKAAGMKLVLLTAKHHDGFCLWPSRYTPHSVAASKWRDGKGDVVKEVVDACRAAGLKVGIYLSPADLNAIERGVYGDGSAPQPVFIPSPVPDRPFRAGLPMIAANLTTYDRLFMNQLYELLTEYGEIAEVWFDGANPKPGTGQTYNREAWYGLIRTLQPKAVIAIDGPDVRWIGNEGGHARSAGEWSVVPVKEPDADDQIRKKMPLVKTMLDLGSRRVVENALKDGLDLHWYPAEMNTSIRGGWFYHPREDGHHKSSVGRLYRLFETGYGGNAVLLLNLSPDKRGLIHEEDVRRLERFGEVIRATMQPAAKIVSAEATNSLEGHAAAAAIDGNPDTWWQPAEGTNRTTLTLRLDKPGAEFDLIQLREAITQGQRIEKFHVRAKTGEGWRWIGEGTTVGNRKLLRVPLTVAQEIKIDITSSRLCPTLSQVSLHRAPVILAAPRIFRDEEGLLRITSAPNLAVRFTMNGDEPDSSSPRWTGPRRFLEGGFVRARAFDPKSGRESEVTSERFDVMSLKWRIHGCSSDQADAGEKAANAIDGNRHSLWHSRWRPDSPEHPHWIAIDFREELDLQGVSYQPRLDPSANGTILDYRIEVSLDGKGWTKIAEAQFENMKNNPGPRRVKFETAVKARYLKLTALSEVQGRAWASAAEIGVITK